MNEQYFPLEAQVEQLKSERDRILRLHNAVFGDEGETISSLEDEDYGGHVTDLAIEHVQDLQSQLAARTQELAATNAILSKLPTDDDYWYIEARVGSQNFRGDVVRFIWDRRGSDHERKYINEPAAVWIKELISELRAALTPQTEVEDAEA